ncbi:hypothetical protein JW766_01340 [Candidatus Dojkabacteria bacterium]|nr:hypothetical protein [Candidatus Dojkabacteria bacterium]
MNEELFINIPELLRDPGVQQQVAVFGDKATLTAWRLSHGLSPQDFPIQPSSFGPHIDIYGNDVESLIPKDRIRPFRSLASKEP